MKKNKITIEIGCIHSKIMNCLSDEISEDLWKYLSFPVPNAKFMIKRMPWWDGRKRLFNRKNNEFLTGMLHRVCKRLKKIHKIKNFCFIWKMEKPEKTLNIKWNNEYVLRDYQENIVKNCISKKRAVISACTGSGKTIVVSKIIQELGVRPFLFYVLSKDLLKQSIKVLEETMPGLEVGRIGDGICDIKDINVMTLQTVHIAFKEKITIEDAKIVGMTLREYKKKLSEDTSHVKSKGTQIRKLIKEARGIYFDECHHCSAMSCEKILKKSPNSYYRFGGSATPVRSDNSYLVIEGLFGRKTSEVSASDLIKKGFLLKPIIKFIDIKTEPHWVNTFTEDYDLHITENEERNRYIVKIALNAIKRGLSTIILIKNISHGESLKKKIDEELGINVDFIYGETAKKKREQAIEDFSEGKIKIMIASVICDEGLDLPILSCLIIASGGKSPTRAKQRVGRVIRKGSIHAEVYDFIDVGRWTAAHSRKRKKMLEEEKEFDIKIVSIEEIFNKSGKLF
ncbi:MAG TPA: DEAD/DEAH box helicase [Candidatus Paceibacterota bacterium]|nr:DEAD/DEAH box helicase [Candidatus Paceibacterota bacterium]